MSLQLILGGSGTGKSTRLYQMIVERSVQFPDEKTLLIVPEQKTMQAQKNIVMHHPRHGVMNVDVLSFERLAYRIFEELGLNQKEILEDTGKSMIIRRILTEQRQYTQKGFCGRSEVYAVGAFTVRRDAGYSQKAKHGNGD